MSFGDGRPEFQLPEEDRGGLPGEDYPGDNEDPTQGDTEEELWDEEIEEEELWEELEDGW